MDAERLEAALFDMHSRLDSLKRAWEQYTTGDADKARAFRERVADFKGRTKDLGNEHLIKLLDAIALVAGKLPDPYPRGEQMMVVEMAAAFLLVEHVIDHFSSPADDLGVQIVIMGGWLLDAATGRSTGEPPPGLRRDLTERIGALQLRATAKEILANLHHVEQALDAYARQNAERGTLAELQPYLRQMHGALSVLGFGRRAVSLCENMILAQARGEGGEPDDLDWIAEGLSSVGFFLEPCRQGREPQEEAIALLPPLRQASDAARSGRHLTDRLSDAPRAARRADADAGRPPRGGRRAAAGVPRGSGRGPGNHPKALPVCRHKPEDREALVSVRRAFHTLKGSGRMVGLMDVGEAAWQVEQVTNLWLEQMRPVSEELLELLETAYAAFSEWIGKLRGPGLDSTIDDSRIAALAARASHAQYRGDGGQRHHHAQPLRDLYQGGAEHIKCCARNARSGARRCPRPRRRTSCAPRTRSPAPRAPPASDCSPSAARCWSSGAAIPRKSPRRLTRTSSKRPWPTSARWSRTSRRGRAGRRACAAGCAARAAPAARSRAPCAATRAAGAREARHARRHRRAAAAGVPRRSAATRSRSRRGLARLEGGSFRRQGLAVAAAPLAYAEG